MERFGRANGQFQARYRCYPVSFLGKSNAENGDKVILPPSALQSLAGLNVEYPMLFEISNPSKAKRSHCGVLEFVADEGLAYLPYWMMQNMLLAEGDVISFRNCSLPKGSYVKIQPHTKDFLDISNPKAVLERTLRTYTCLTVGDHFVVHYNNKRYMIEVREARPSEAVSVVETDCEVDFEAPKDYVEPVRQPTPAEAAPAAQEEASGEQAAPAGSNMFDAFSGSGRRLDGKQAAPSSGPVAVDLGSLGAQIRRYEWREEEEDKDGKKGSTSGSSNPTDGSGKKAGKMVGFSNRLEEKLAQQKVGGAAAAKPNPAPPPKAEEGTNKPGSTFSAFSGKPNSLR